MVRADAKQAARRLKDEAAELVARGKHKKALELYRQLERLEPSDGAWARRAGEMHRALGDSLEAVAAWTRSADLYARAGFVVKAIAVCRLILRAEPEHTETQARLAALNRERGIGTAPPGAVADLAGADAIAKVPLGEVIAGAERRLDAAGNDSGVSVIPIEWVEETPEEAAAQAARAALTGAPLFSELPSRTLERLIPEVELRDLAADEVLFRENDQGDAMYVIAEGELAVVSEGPPRRALARLGEGQFVGEIALVTDEPRIATVEAAERSQLVAIGRTALRSLLADEPGSLPVLLRFLRERLVGNLVATSPLFEPFSVDERRGLADRFGLLEIEPGAEVVVQGGSSPGLYLLLSGRVEVTRRDGDSERTLATLGRGDIFGEMSLLTREPAIATVRTASKALLLELPAGDFREVIMTHPQILAHVGELADQRRRQLERALDGTAAWDEGRLRLP